ncbi:MAG: hypothetical protein U0586_02050 [Candidatus Brocadiaceae bacterium]
MKFKNTGIFLMVVSCYAIFCLDEDSIRRLLKEDGLVEYAGAFCFLAAAGLFFASYVRSSGSGNNFAWLCTRRNIFYLFLGVFFFVAFGEEISWGQRIFHMTNGELFNKINKQKEMNIHNLWIFSSYENGVRAPIISGFFTIEKFFHVFWFLFCFVIPIVHKYSLQASRVLNHIGIPRAPVWIGVLLCVNYVFSKVVSKIYAIYSPGSYIQTWELKESLSAFIFAILACHGLKNSYLIKDKKGNSLTQGETRKGGKDAKFRRLG